MDKYVFQPKPSYTYNDIGLVPREKSEIKSRKVEAGEIDATSYIFATRLDLPIIVSPMDTVVGPRMAWKTRQQGGLAVLPRSVPLSGVSETFRLQEEYEVDGSVAASVPATGDYIEKIKALHAMKVFIICVDLANGYSQVAADALKQINKLPFRDDLYIICGNVASLEGYHFLAGLGVNGVRVGIGGGSVCTTSIATGIGVGQATVVRELVEEIGPDIIADGGIKTPGDVVKAIALGADFVMVGGMFAGCEETPGEVVKHNGQLWKHFAGQASMHIKGSEEFVEGADLLVPYKGSMTKTWRALEEGIRSGMSYMNAKTIKELRGLPDDNFTLLSDAAKAERGVHARNS